MANFISPTTVQKIGALLSSGHSHRAIARAIGIKRSTVARYATKLQPEKCICGKEARHKGWCGPRYLKSSVHRELLAQIHTDYVEPIKPTPQRRIKPTIRMEYPYCIGGPSEGNALLMCVNAAVSKRLPDDARADICQDLLLSILEGDVKLDDLTAAAQSATYRRNAMFSIYKNLSLDAPASIEPDGTVLTFIDILPADYDPTLVRGHRS